MCNKANSAFGPSFTADRDDSVTHFLCLYYFGGSDLRVMCIFYEKMSRMCVGVSVVMYE